ncbi:MAG: MerR family transcriptional regulator [Propionibacteriaceae bacterium]
MRIGDVAERTGVSPRMIRYYQQRTPAQPRPGGGPAPEFR